MINESLGDPNASHKELDRKVVMADFRRARRRSTRFKYWSAEVEVRSLGDDLDYKILRTRGFKIPKTED